MTTTNPELDRFKIKPTDECKMAGQNYYVIQSEPMIYRDAQELIQSLASKLNDAEKTKKELDEVRQLVWDKLAEISLLNDEIKKLSNTDTLRQKIEKEYDSFKRGYSVLEGWCINDNGLRSTIDDFFKPFADGCVAHFHYIYDFLINIDCYNFSIKKPQYYLRTCDYMILNEYNINSNTQTGCIWNWGRKNSTG